MPGTQPAVEIAMLRAPSPKPSASLARWQKPSTSSTFCSGSPMPISTTLPMRCPSPRASRAAHSSCSKISPRVRSRPRPMAPVAQNVQPSAQPDCDDTQTVRRSRPCRISTVSSGKPSRVRKLALIVPSAASCVVSSSSSANGTVASRCSRSARDSVVTSSHEVTRSRVTAWRT